MSEYVLLISTIVLIAIITSVIFVLLVQRQRSMTLSAHQKEWENVQERSLHIWEVQQEKRMLEQEHSLVARIQQIEKIWETWKAKDTSLIASTAEQSHATLTDTLYKQEVVRLPYIDEVPLREQN